MWDWSRECLGLGPGSACCCEGGSSAGWPFYSARTHITSTDVTAIATPVWVINPDTWIRLSSFFLNAVWSHKRRRPDFPRPLRPVLRPTVRQRRLLCALLRRSLLFPLRQRQPTTFLCPHLPALTSPASFPPAAGTDIDAAALGARIVAIETEFAFVMKGDLPPRGADSPYSDAEASEPLSSPLSSGSGQTPHVHPHSLAPPLTPAPPCSRRRRCGRRWTALRQPPRLQQPASAAL